MKQGNESFNLRGKKRENLFHKSFLLIPTVRAVNELYMSFKAEIAWKPVD